MPEQKPQRALSSLMVAGSLTGAALAFLAVLILAALGEATRPWSFSFSGWWHGPYPGLRFASGLGLILLMSTPVVALLLILVQMARARRWSAVLTGFVLFLVLAAGLALNLVMRPG